MQEVENNERLFQSGVLNLTCSCRNRNRDMGDIHIHKCRHTAMVEIQTIVWLRGEEK